MDVSKVWVNVSTEESGSASNLEYDRRMAADAEAGRKVLEARGVKDIPWTAVEKRVAAADLERRFDPETVIAPDTSWREAAQKRSAAVQKQLDDEWLLEARKRTAAVEEELRSVVPMRRSY